MPHLITISATRPSMPEYHVNTAIDYLAFSPYNKLYLRTGGDHVKIERINENQIKCILEKSDLRDHDVELSELAYGNEKTRELFRDMMEQASYEVGFEPNDMPILIEAVPMAGGGLTLYITKTDEPEELDARFARFTETDEEPGSLLPQDKNKYNGADEILDLFKKITEDIEKAAENAPDDEKVSKDDISINLSKVFRFRSLSRISDLARELESFFKGTSRLYKDPSDGSYFLVLDKSGDTPASFNRVCNIAAEYGEAVKCTVTTIAYFDEHFELIIPSDAVNILKKF